MHNSSLNMIVHALTWDNRSIIVLLCYKMLQKYFLICYNSQSHFIGTANVLKKTHDQSAFASGFLKYQNINRGYYFLFVSK